MPDVVSNASKALSVGAVVQITVGGMLSEVDASVGKLLSAIETDLVSPARNRKRPADVAVPATKDSQKDVAHSRYHLSTCWQSVVHLLAHAPACALKLLFLRRGCLLTVQVMHSR